MKRDLTEEFTLARRLTNILDTKFKFGAFSFGLDPILDVVPVLGSVVGAFTSLYIFRIAYVLNAPNSLYFRMLFNIVIDFWLGSVPVVGVVFDALYKGNVRNLKLVEKYYDRMPIDV